MEKTKLILQGFWGVFTVIIQLFFLVCQSISFLFIKIIDSFVLLFTLFMQVFFVNLFYLIKFFIKFCYVFVSIIIKLTFAIIKEGSVFLFFGIKYTFLFFYQVIVLFFNVLKKVFYKIILYLIGLPFLIIFICLSYKEKEENVSDKLKQYAKNKKDLLEKYKHKYYYGLKKYCTSKYNMFYFYIKLFTKIIFSYANKTFFRINSLLKKVIYNVYYSIKNSLSFLINFIIVFSILLNSSVLVIFFVFTKRFWLKFFKEVYNFRIVLKKLFKAFLFESTLLIKHSRIFIKNLLLFLCLDILSFKKMIYYVKSNLLKSFATLVILFFLVYGFVVFIFNSTEYDKLSKKWGGVFLIVNTPNLISKIVYSELFKPLIYYKTTFEVYKGSNLYNSLVNKGIDSNNAVAVVNSLKKSFDLTKIKPSWVINSVVVSSNDWAFNKIQKLSLPIDNKFDLVVEADNNYNYTAYKQEKKLVRYILRRKAIVKDSIYSSAIEAGISPAIAMEVFRVLSWDIDFQRDIKENNSLEVVFECIYNEDDDLVTCDNLLFASITGDKVTSFYKYNGSYYHDDGRSVIKTLVKTPINNARISSGFGMRKHPILGYTAAHKGVDFAAPTGTPVYASGDGVVEMEYKSSSYGNYIRIHHNPYLSSAYAHLNGFAKGIKVGTKVKQWQLIAYAGSTGRATGPHLHYEILVNGKQVNPLTIKMPSNMRLTQDKMLDFRNYMSTLNTLSIRIPTKGKIVSPLTSEETFDMNLSNNSKNTQDNKKV